MLLFTVIVLILILWFLISSENKSDKRYKNLQDEYQKLQLEHQNLKSKYEAQKFELKKYKDEDVRRNKEVARECLTDTAYWMKRSFENAKRYNELKSEFQNFEDIKFKIVDMRKCKITIQDKQIKKKAQTEYNDFIKAVVRDDFKNFEYILKNYTFLLDYEKSQRLQYVLTHKREIIKFMERYLYLGF